MTREPSGRERAFFGEAVEVVTPATRSELADVIRAAEADGRPVVPAGVGAHTFPGAPAANALVVSTAAIHDIVVYEPDDFTVGVEAGMPLARLRAELAANGQELPVDLGAAAAGTVGGLVARAPIGPRQHRNGALSALLLGAEGVRGDGVPFRSGGMVVKNVAGYQVHKLLVGAAGRTGVILRANFRLRPLPERREVRFAAGTADDVARCADALKDSGLEPVVWILLGEAVTHLRHAGAPVPPGDAAVAWLLEGSDARVRWQSAEAERIVRESGMEPAEAATNEDAVRAVHECAAMTEPEGAPTDEGAVRVVVVPSRTMATASAAYQLVTAAGVTAAVVADPFVGCVNVRWQADGPDDVGAPIAPLTELVRGHGDVGRVLYLPPGFGGPSPLLTADPSAALAERILGVFDPNGTFVAAGARP